MMKIFRQMVDYCLRFGLADDVSTIKRLSNLYHPALRYDSVSYYKLDAISKAAGMLTNKKSMRRGYTNQCYEVELCSVSTEG